MLRYNDIFEEGIFKRFAQEAEEALKVVNELKKSLLELAGALAQKGVQEATQDVAAAARTYGELSNVLKTYNQIKKEEQSLNRTINRALEEQAAELAKLKKITTEAALEEQKYKAAVREATGDLRKLIKEEKALEEALEIINKLRKGEIKTYAEATDALEKLQLAYKSLAIAGKATSKEAMEIGAAVRTLDANIKAVEAAVGQFQRNVGDYLNQFRNALESTVVKTIDLGKGWESVGAVATNTLVSLIQNLIAARTQTQLFLSVVSTLRGAIAGLAIALVIDLIGQLQQKLAFIGEEFRKQLQDLYDIYALERDIERLKGKQLDIARQDFDLREQYKRGEISLAFLEKQLLQTVEQKQRLSEKEFEFNQQIINLKRKQLELELARAQAESDPEKYKQVFNAITELALENERLINSFRENQEEIRRQFLAIAEFVDAERKKIKAYRDEFLGFLRSVGDDLVVRLREIAAIPQQLRQKYAEIIAFLRQNNAITVEELQKFNQAVRQVARAELDKVFESLNQQIDEVADGIFKTNSYLAQVASYTKSYEKLEELLQKVSAAIEAGFGKKITERLKDTQKRIELIMEAIVSMRDNALEDILRRDLAATLNDIIEQTKAYADALKNTGDTEEKLIATTENIIELESELRKKRMQGIIEELKLRISELQTLKDVAEISEDVYKPLLEALEQRKKLTEELLQKEAELVEIRKQEAMQKIFEESSRKRIQAINEEFELRKKQAEAFFILQKDREKALFELEIQRQKAIIDFYRNLQKQRDLTRLEQKELTDAILELQKVNTKTVGDTLENIARGLDSAVDKVQDTILKLREIQIESLEALQDAVKSDLDFYRSLVEKGNLAAFESYTKIVEQERKIREEIARERREMMRRDAILTLLKAFTNLAASGNASGALTSTLNAASAIASAVSRLGLHRGTEYVSEKHGVPINRAIDGILVRLHIGERVIPKELNEKLGGISNKQLVDKVVNNNSVEVKYDYDAFDRALIKMIRKPGSVIISRRYG